MAKEITGQIKLQIPAGQANPAPPVGPALGQQGVNIMAFCKEFNAATAKLGGDVLPTVITVYKDKSFTFITKQPPASILLKKAANIASGSGEPNKKRVAKITKKQLLEVAKQKLPDLNANDIDNTPVSILESFAAGLLVVTTEAGGIPYILEHERTGLMVKCGDHEALAASAIRLLGDPVLAARLALNARESVLSFTRATVCDEWLSLYRKLTAQKVARRALVSEKSYEAVASVGTRKDRG